METAPIPPTSTAPPSTEPAVLTEQGAQAKGQSEERQEQEQEQQVSVNHDVAASNVSSAIFFKISTKSLNPLRDAFELVPEGLNLTQFLEAFVKNMDLEENEEELLRIVPDLLDFFKSVDINGDGKMEWSEFVAFGIESVVTSDPPITEKFVSVSRHTVQPAGLRATVKCSRMMPEFKCLFVGVGSQIVIYETDDQSSTWLSPKGVRINLLSRDASGSGGGSGSGSSSSSGGGANPSSSGSGGGHGGGTGTVIADVKKQKKEKESGPRAKVDNRLQQTLCSLDFVYLMSKELLIVLRSDLCLEFHKFMSRNKIHADFILPNGVWPLTQPYNRLALRETHSAPWRLFAIGENRKVVDSWLISVGVSGAVELSDYQPLEKHTDFLRDVLVIHTELYDFLVTCGMDKRVYLWDLTTLEYRATRSGHSGGVQCVAFDGKSILLAGGFDFKIIAWDLDAEIDRPLFQLWGHTSVITKIVAIGSINRAFSLDVSGQVRLWDTSKASPNDKEERQIDDVSFTEDSFRQIDILRNVSTNFSTAHRVIVTMQGRRNHVYKLVDTAPTESAPLSVLFSTSLLTLLTVHSFDVIFFSAVTGWEQNKLDRVALGLEDSPGNEVQTGVLDDRERKLILGDSAGGIVVYNCLSGVRLKTLATQIPFSCRFMLYTPEKIVIAIAGPGELYILDELPNFPTSDMTMRDTRAHDVDVVAVAYSYELGLIATADCTGTVCVFSFEFLSLEAVIHDCAGTEIGQVAFIGKFPLLLVTDSCNNFTVIPLGPTRFGKTLFRVESEVFLAGDSSRASALSVLEMTSDELAQLVERDENSQDAHASRAQVGDEEEEETMSSNKPLTKRQINDYLRNRRECKSISVLVQKSERLRADEKVIPDNEAMDVDASRLAELLGNASDQKVEKKEVDEDEEAAFLAAINGTKVFDPDEEKKEKLPQAATIKVKKKPQKVVLPGCASLGFPSAGVRVFVLCGYDDGSITVSDLTPTMRAINVGELEKHEQASMQTRYDPRRMSRKKTTDYEKNRAVIWTEKEVSARLRHTTCRVSLVWGAHNGAVTTLKVVCDSDILTGSADCSVMLWTLDGRQKAVLTRGREWDKLLRPRWTTPVDMEKRQRQRRQDAHLLVQHLGLSKLMKKKPRRRRGEVEKELVFGEPDEGEHGKESELDNESLSLAHSPHKHSGSHGAHPHSHAPASLDAKSMLKAHFNADSHAPQLQSSSSHHQQLATDDTSIGMSVLSHGDHGSMNFDDDPDRVRVIGQLRGKVTYHQSTKDAAKDMLAQKYADMQQGEVKREKRRPRKGGGFSDELVDPEPSVGANGRIKVVKSVPARYLDDLMSVGSDGASLDGVTPQALEAAAAGEKKRKIRTKYDVELEKLDADEPHNWEIHSSNRQRLLYGRLYQEMDKKGYTKDPNAVFEAKLNTLSGGDFRLYVEKLHEERLASRSKTLSKNSKTSLSHSNSIATLTPALPGEVGSLIADLTAKVSVVSVQLGEPGQLDYTQTHSLERSDSLVANSNSLANSAEPGSDGLKFDLDNSLNASMTRHLTPQLMPPSPKPISPVRTDQASPLVNSSINAAAITAKRSSQKLANSQSAPALSQSPLAQVKSQAQVTLGNGGLGSSLALSSSYLTLTTSPEKVHHRATPAELAAIAERQAILLKSDEFDRKLKAADKLARVAARKIKKQKAQYRKLARSMSAMALGDDAYLTLGATAATADSGAAGFAFNTSATGTAIVTSSSSTGGVSLPRIATAEFSPQSQHGQKRPPSAPGTPAVPESPLSPMTAVVKEVLALKTTPAPLPFFIPSLPNTRHTHANMMLDKQTSIDGVMEVTRRQKAAELNWVRKAKSVAASYTLYSASETSPLPGDEAAHGGEDRGRHGHVHGHVHRGGKQDDKSKKSSNESTTSSISANRTKQQRQDQRLLARQAFGPYSAKELLGLLRAFQSLPEVFVEKKEEQPVHIVREETPVGDAEDDDDWGFDEPIDPPHSLEADTHEAAAEEEPVLDAAEQAERERVLEEQRVLIEQERQEREEREQKERIEAEEAAAEQRHAEQVMAISTKLQPLIQHPYIRQRPACKAAAEKYLQARVEAVKQLPHYIVLSMADLLACTYPLMKPDDRRQCLRFFVLHTPSEDVSEAAERGVTVPQLKKLREMFTFFDTDGSGGIDKVEILAVLRKLAENKGEGPSEVSDDLIQSVMGNSGQDLTFNDFATIFRGLVQND